MNPRPQGHDLKAVAVTDEVIVAVNERGSLIASTDGVRWRASDSTTEYDLHDVIWANGRFVAIGGKSGEEFRPLLGVVLTSTDGFLWIEQHRIDYFWIKAVVWDGKRFVAVGKGAKALFSSDGIVWSEETIEQEIWDLEDIVWDGDRYVGIGHAYGDEWSPSLFLSNDVLTWQRTSFDCECDLSAIAWSGNLYVAVGGAWPGNAYALISSDTQVWEELSWEHAGSFNDVIHGNEGFVAVGVHGLVATSPDGQYWAFQEPLSETDVSRVASTGDGYLAVGKDGFMMTSHDGVSWQEFSSDSLELPSFFRIAETAIGGGVVVGVGTDGVIVTSTDGLAWVRQPTVGPGFVFSVRWNETEFIAAADYGIMRSPDGVEWELMHYDPDVHFSDVTSNGSVFVAVGWDSSPDGTTALIATSTDGLEWTYEWIDAGGVPSAVCWTGQQFVAVGGHGLHLTSPDGFGWSQHPLNEDIHLYDMEWNGHRLVAVGKHRVDGKRILSSIDGVHWDPSTPSGVYAGGFTDVIWTGANFIAVDPSVRDTIFTSSDGLYWSTELTGMGLKPDSVGGDENILYLIGRGGKIIRRIDAGYLPPLRRPSRRVSPVPGKVGRVLRIER